MHRDDADFSTTAVHGIDTARTIAGSDYAHISFRYQTLPGFSPRAANIFVDCTMRSGATMHLAFCPLSGAVIERATVYLVDRVYWLNLPVWNQLDAPGRLQSAYQGRLDLDVSGPELSGTDEAIVVEGFYGENKAFFDDIRAGRRPIGDLQSARQSVEIMQALRERRPKYRLTP